jgi:hypothetical protein
MNERRALWLRLGIGLVQGFALFALHRVREDAPPIAFGAAWLVMLLLPVAALGALGRLRGWALTAWTAGGGLSLAALGGYERGVWVRAPNAVDVFPSLPVVLLAAGALHRPSVGDGGRRRGALAGELCALFR